MKNLSFIEASQTEIGAYSQLLTEVFSKMSPEILETNIKCANHVFFCKEHDRVVAGMMLRTIIRETFCLGGIGGVAVTEQHRGKGLGVRLIEYVLGQKNIYDGYILWTHVPGFFRKCGFKDAHEWMHSSTSDVYPMIRLVNAKMNGTKPASPWKIERF